MASIKVSQLNEQINLSTVDFFPLVNSSSLITYRADLNTLKTVLGIPQISMSWSSQSLSSSYALSASFPPYPQISSSYTDVSVSASYSLTASFAPFSQYVPQFSCSWVSQSISASYALSASWAPLPSFVKQISCSLAISESFSASYALSASWAPGTQNSTQLIPLYITPFIFLNTQSPSSVAIYPIPNPERIVNGIIIQGYSSIVNAGGGESGIFYISSSLTSLMPLASLIHGNTVNTLFLPVSNNNSNIYITASNLNVAGTSGIDTWSVSMIGYY
jgi:hypothetical protein